MARRTGRAISLLALILLVPAITAQQAFVCPNSFYSWQPVLRVNTGFTGVAATPANDTRFNPGGLSFNYFAIGTRLFAYQNSNGAQLWSFLLAGTTVQNFPSPVPLSSGAGELLFVTTEDARLWKLSAT